MKKRRILVTGASSGIGAALVRETADPGAEFLLIARDATRLDTVVKQARAAGAGVEIACLDVRKIEAVRDAIKDFAEDGGIDQAFLAAGVKAGNLRGIEPEGQADRIFDVNLKAVVSQVETLLEGMKDADRGHIVLFSSMAALAPQPDLLSYSASKSAIRAYGSALRRALRGTHIGVHIVTLGFVDTPMTDRHGGPTPIKMSAEGAARKILRGVEKRKPYISLPMSLMVLIRLQNLLPTGLADWIDSAFRASIEPDSDEVADAKNDEP